MMLRVFPFLQSPGKQGPGVDSVGQLAVIGVSESSWVSGDGLRGRAGWAARSVQSAMRAALMAQAVSHSLPGADPAEPQQASR
jgi:hypothetical protein